MNFVFHALVSRLIVAKLLESLGSVKFLYERKVESEELSPIDAQHRPGIREEYKEMFGLSPYLR